MKQNANSGYSAGYNIYNSTNRRSGNDRRKKFVIICLFICMICIILDIIFISKLVSKGKKDVVAPTSSSSAPVLTDESGSVIVPPSDSSSDTPASESEGVRTQTVDAQTRATNLAAVQTQIADYLNKQTGRFGVYYINMNNGETLAFNESQPIVAASSIKIAYNTYLYEKAAAGELTMDEKIIYNAAKYPNGDYEGGTGTIQNSADGTEYTLYDVSHLSITVSDNCGTNMVLRRLGGEDAVNNNYMKTISSVVDYRSDVQYTDYAGTATHGRRRTSAIDLAKYAEHLYKDYMADKEHYQPLINDLCNTEYNWGVPGGVPSNVTVAHKVGFHDAYYTNNDVGIVFGTEDYVLAVMTESGNALTAQQIIGEVSKMIYDYVESNYA